MCPGCDSFYYKKCVQTLSDLENVCWVCDIALDDQKPVTPEQTEDQQVLVEKINKDSKDKRKQEKEEKIFFSILSKIS